MVNTMTNMGAGYALSSYTVPSNTNILVELPKYIYISARLSHVIDRSRTTESHVIYRNRTA